MRARLAFVDESLSNETRDPYTYILSAAICDASAVDDVRASIAGLRLKHQVKVHWHDEDDKRRQLITETIASGPSRHLIVVRSGRPSERVERQRQKCLERLLWEVQTLGVQAVTIESRGSRGDHRDRATADRLRARQVVPSSVRVEHIAGRSDPMLWVADALCGATVQHRTGDPAFLETIRAGTEGRLIAIGGR